MATVRHYGTILATILFLIAGNLSGKSDTSIAMGQPEVVKAFALAYVDFKGHLKVDRDSTTEFGRFLSDADNYKITVTPSKEAVRVQFSPKEFNGVLVRGGSCIYSIDSTGKRIVALEMTR